MNKSYLLAAMTVILSSLLGGCSEMDEFANSEQTPMDFTVFANKTPRAAESGSSLSQDGKAFGVWGYSTYNGTTTTVFDNQNVKYNANKWEYSPIKYWDKLSAYELYAYYPYQLTSTLTPKITIDAGKISVENFTVDPVIADQVDLMIASKVSRAANAGTNSVSFDFNHILSNINLSFKRGTGIGTTKLTLKSVKLYGMDNKGSFAQTASSAVAGSWTLSGTNVITQSTATELAGGTGLIVPESNAATNYVAFNDMLFIPQQLTAALKLDIVYALGANEDQTFTRTLDLYNVGSLTQWKQNQKITYNFTIDADAIQFGNPKIEEWQPSTEAGVPVN